MQTFLALNVIFNPNRELFFLTEIFYFINAVFWHHKIIQKNLNSFFRKVCFSLSSSSLKLDLFYPYTKFHFTTSSVCVIKHLHLHVCLRPHLKLSKQKSESHTVLFKIRNTLHNINFITPLVRLNSSWSLQRAHKVRVYTREDKFCGRLHKLCE